MSKPELKPCPFCGGKAAIGTKSFDLFNVAAYVFCKKCGARTDLFYKYVQNESKQMARDAWNKRVND